MSRTPEEIENFVRLLHREYPSAQRELEWYLDDVGPGRSAFISMELVHRACTRITGELDMLFGPNETWREVWDKKYGGEWELLEDPFGLQRGDYRVTHRHHLSKVGVTVFDPRHASDIFEDPARSPDEILDYCPELRVVDREGVFDREGKLVRWAETDQEFRGRCEKLFGGAEGKREWKRVRDAGRENNKDGVVSGPVKTGRTPSRKFSVGQAPRHHSGKPSGLGPNEVAVILSEGSESEDGV